MGNSVVVVVAGEDKTGEVFNAVKKHLDDTKAKARETSDSLGAIGQSLMHGLQAAGIAVGVREIVDGFKRMIDSSVELGMELGHLSQQTGISVQNLSVMKYMSDVTGVSFETLSKGFKKMSTDIFEWQHGEKMAGRAFEDLGISLKDVQAKGQDMYGIMSMIADKFKTMPDGPQKLAISTQLFGRAGQQLIPVLNQGSSAVEEFRGKAEALGLVLDEDGVKKMEALHASAAELKGSFEGLGLSITSSLAPSLEWLAKEIPQVLGIGGQGAHGNDFAAGIQAIADAAHNAKLELAKMGLYSVGDSKGAEQIGIDDARAQRAAWDKAHAGVPGGKDGTPAPAPGAPSPGWAPSTDAARMVTVSLSDSYAAYWKNHVTPAIQEARDRIKQAQEDAAKDAQELAADAWRQMNKSTSDMGVFGSNSPNVVLAPRTWKDQLEQNAPAIAGAGEKIAHSVFDPLFSFGGRWDQQWKQIRDGLLRDLGQLAESQLFGALFGDPQGRGGQGLSGTSWQGNPLPPGRGGLENPAGGALGKLLGIFTHRGDSVASNGGLGAGAGTVPTAAASLLQMGNRTAGGGVQVVLNNNGAPLQVDQTMQQNAGEQQVVHVVLKQLSTNGPIAQGIMGLLSSGMM
jgi:hypothetical protein